MRTDWLPGPLPPDVALALDRLQKSPAIAQIAVMPDVHLADTVCVGVALGTYDRLLPQAVGGDIGCGVSTVRLDGELTLDAKKAAATLRGLARDVPIQRRSRGPAHAIEGPCSPALVRDARRNEFEFATLGRGNHFLELQRDDAGAAWLLVHSGSRALGPAVRDRACAQGVADASGCVVLDADSGAGRSYLANVAWLVAWAEASRARMLAAACAVVEQVCGLRAVPETWFDASHNHVRREVIGGDTLWVHRKGACPAHVGQAGIIPGSMGTPTFHVEGRGDPASLCSSSHGAGREMSRTEARARVTPTALRRQMAGIWYPLGDLREEAPGAYKDIEAVMRAQRALVWITRRLRPVLCWRGPA